MVPETASEAAPAVISIEDDDEDVPAESSSASKVTPKQNKAARPRPQTEPRPATNTNKRARDVLPEDDDAAPPSKRRINVPTTSAVTKPDDPFWMFDTKSESDDEAPAKPQRQPRTWAERLKQERKDRERKKRLAAIATPPRSQVRQRMPQPLRSQPLSSSLSTSEVVQYSPPQPSLATEPAQVSSDLERHSRDERSAAPEPETPKPSLFGSLRSIGSAAVSRLLGSSPAKKDEADINAASSSYQTPTKAAAHLADQSLQYPSIEPVEDYNQDTVATPHTERTATPATPATEPARPHTLTFTERAFYSARKERRKKLNNPNTPGIVYNTYGRESEPLFGPYSRYAQGENAGPRKFIGPPPDSHFGPRRVEPSLKRTVDALLGPAPEQSKSKPFSPDVMDEEEDDSVQQSSETSDDPSTPAAKRQKLLDTTLQTPRSAMKKAATIGASVARSAKSVNFHANPVSDYKTISPVMGRESVLEYKHRPGKLFSLQSDIDAYEQEMAQQQAASPDTAFGNSPNTQFNTDHNRFSGLKSHPGSALSEAINEKTGGGAIQFVWSDPNNPDWKPSLGNPRPGTFSSEFLDLVDEDGDVSIPELDIDREDETVSPAKKPVQPQTPRMSHAELPKSPGTPTTTAESVNEASTLMSTEPVNDTTQRNLAKARENAEKFKPRSHSRLSEVTAARSRSPSPPLDELSHPPELAADDGGSVSGTSDGAHTPPPFATRTFETATGRTSIIDPADDTLPKPEWTWSDVRQQHVSNHASYPDFHANELGWLVPSMTLRTPSGERDDTIVGPDNMTSKTRDEVRMKQAMEENDFSFDRPQTYEEAGTGSAYITGLIDKAEAANPDILNNASWDKEWEEHRRAIEAANAAGATLVATYGNDDEEMAED